MHFVQRQEAPTQPNAAPSERSKEDLVERLDQAIERFKTMRAENRFLAGRGHVQGR